MNINDIKTATEDYATAARELRNIKEEFDASIGEIHKKYSQKLIDASNKAAETKQMVLTLLGDKDAPALFIKPKTISVNGVTVGFRKKIGKLNIINEESTVAMIYEKLPGKAPMLLNVKTSVSKKALEELNADELKKIGVSVEADTDEPVVKISDGDIQKLIDAAMKSHSIEVE